MREKFVRITTLWIATACGMFLVVWALVITAYVISRFFGQGWVFIEEFTGYGLVWIAFLPLAHALITGKHITVEVVIRRLPDKVRNKIQIVTDGIGLVIVCWLLYRGIDWVIRGVEQNIHSESRYFILMWPIYLGVPIGLSLLALALAVNFGKSKSTQKED